MHHRKKDYNPLCLQGRIIKKAFGKLKLEHVVIAKGQFQQDRVKPNTLEVGMVCPFFFMVFESDL